MHRGAAAQMVFRRPAHHYVVKLKEGVVEVLADDLRVERIAGAPHDAVLLLLNRGYMDTLRASQWSGEAKRALR